MFIKQTYTSNNFVFTAEKAIAAWQRHVRAFSGLPKNLIINGKQSYPLLLLLHRGQFRQKQLLFFVR